MKLSDHDQKLIAKVKEFLKNNPADHPASLVPNRDPLASKAIELLDKAYEWMNNQVNSQA